MAVRLAYAVFGVAVLVAVASGSLFKERSPGDQSFVVASGGEGAVEAVEVVEVPVEAFDKGGDSVVSLEFRRSPAADGAIEPSTRLVEALEAPTELIDPLESDFGAADEPMIVGVFEDPTVDSPFYGEPVIIGVFTDPMVDGEFEGDPQIIGEFTDPFAVDDTTEVELQSVGEFTEP